MLRRLNLDQPGTVHKPSWPEGPTKYTPVFVGRPPFRRLVVLADAELIDELDEKLWRPHVLLAGLLSHGLIDCIRYADEGPPSDVQTNEVASLAVTPGWAILLPSGVAPDIWEVRTGGEHRVARASIRGSRTNIAAQDTQTPVYEDMEAGAASERRSKDALAAQVAECVHADIHVTERPYLHAREKPVVRGVTVVDVDQALPLISLYLRAQGEYLVYRSHDGRDTFRLNRGLFFWVGARELVPAAWRWFNGLAQHSVATGDDTLFMLAQSALMRITRALQVRDALHVALNRPQDNDVADDALSSLDLIFLLLMGAVDATARVVHHALNLKGSVHGAAWQYPKWLAKVAEKVAAFDGVIGSGSKYSHALTILTTLRNSVHGEALQPLAFRKGSQPQQTLVGIPSEDAQGLLDAVAALGWQRLLVFEKIVPGYFHTDPGVLLEHLLPLTLDLLNTLMETTPVEGLSGVTLIASQVVPPPEEPFDERTRLSVRWQLGF